MSGFERLRLSWTISPICTPTPPIPGPRVPGNLTGRWLGAGQGNPGDRHRRLPPSTAGLRPEEALAGAAVRLKDEDTFPPCAASAAPTPVRFLLGRRSAASTNATAQSSQTTVRARFRLGRAAERHSGGHRQYRVRWPPDPEAGQPISWRSAHPPDVPVPAHVWTPVLPVRLPFRLQHRSARRLTPNVFALETGLSSDPAMNR